MEYWQGPARWINTALVAVLVLFGLHGLLLIVGAQETNPIVGLVAPLARGLLTPVAGFFPGQGPLVTVVLGAVAAVMTALVVLAVLRGRQERRAGGSGQARPRSGAAPPRSTDLPASSTDAVVDDLHLRQPTAQRRTGS